MSEKGTNFKKEGREGSRDAETSVTFVWLDKPQSTADLTLWNSRDTNTNSAVWLEHKQSGERWMTVWSSTFMAPSSPNQHSHILNQQVLPLSLGPGVDLALWCSFISMLDSSSVWWWKKNSKRTRWESSTSECSGIKTQREEEARQWSKIESLLWRAVFISLGEYIKLVEREKEARGECSTHREAEADLRAPRKLRNQRRVDNLHTQTIVGKVSLLCKY